MNAFSRHMRPKDRLISSGYTCWWSAVASNPLLFSDETGVIGLPQYFEPASPPFSWRPIFVRWSCSRWWQAPPWWKVEMWADCSRTHFLPGFRTWWGQVVAAVNAITCNEGKSVKRHIVCWKVYTFQELKNYTMTIAPHCQLRKSGSLGSSVIQLLKIRSNYKELCSDQVFSNRQLFENCYHYSFIMFR